MKKKLDEAGSSGEPGTAKMNPSDASKSGRLDREVQVKIGHQLRAMYDEVVKEGVPSHLEDILSRFEKKD